uniref:AAA+ ATPase domain-containing protein n=1 Tax=Spongospora subterranea TaxID=70186 RepID=A0A0H5R4H3_9EUKA|eukprot:CRZ09038.1 hypothetical protein [Spongospora subterranea]
MRRGGASSTWRGPRGSATGRGSHHGRGRGGNSYAAGRGNYRGRGRGRSGSPRRSPSPIGTQDAAKLFALWRNKDGDALAKSVLHHEKQWLEFWRTPTILDKNCLRTLIETLAKMPFSSNMKPPPIMECSGAVSSFAQRCFTGGDPDEDIEAVQIIFNLVVRLLKVKWVSSQAEVRQGLESMLNRAASGLHFSLQEHRNFQSKILDLLNEFEKPWTIKIDQEIAGSEAKNTGIVEAEDGPVDLDLHNDWHSATVGWLCKPALFEPPSLPKMQTPTSSSKGVYESTDEYFNTVTRLWTAMTFGDGNSALSPKCRVKEGERVCGNVLWSLRGNQSGERLHCRTPRCHNLVILACGNSRHSSGLCGKCARSARLELLGGSGNSACTHVYDAVVSNINFDDRIFFHKVKSRRPPTEAIHWRTTSRLSTPNLIGIVKQATPGASLALTDPILWAEIGFHNPSESYHEFQYREKGCVTATLISCPDDASRRSINVQEGDRFAIIDCQTFVPEFIPVLKALNLQQQDQLPFKAGQLLNLCGRHCAAIQVIDEPLCPTISLESLISDMIKRSELDPIIDIRRDAALCSELETKMARLVSGATLDKGQLTSFLESLRHQVHLTQGPPGTGKSYLGVIIVRALLLIRDYWKQVCPSVGEPPILVLSYKNHAIDEFLVDLVKSDHLTPRSLIRIGGSCNEPRLMAYSEQANRAGDASVTATRRKLSEIHRRRNACRSLLKAFSPLDAYNVAVQEVEQIDPHNKDALKTARVGVYSAVSGLVSLLAKSKPFLMKAGETIDEDGLDLLLSSELSLLQTSDMSSLYDGIRHYDAEINPHEIVLKWISGFTPLPSCSFVDDIHNRCNKIATDAVISFCELHRCQKGSDNPEHHCPEAVLQDKPFCAKHACQAEECVFRKLQDPQTFCRAHACFKCLREPDSIAKLALESPPRNTCDDHPLCFALVSGRHCSESAVDGSDRCLKHSANCQAVTFNSRPCRFEPISIAIPYCKQHKDQHNTPHVKNRDEFTSDMLCFARTRRGAKCKSNRLPPSPFCRNHASCDQPVPSFFEESVNVLNPSKNAVEPAGSQTTPSSTSQRCIAIRNKTKTQCKGDSEPCSPFCTNHRNFRGDVASIPEELSANPSDERGFEIYDDKIPVSVTDFPNLQYDFHDPVSAFSFRHLNGGDHSETPDVNHSSGPIFQHLKTESEQGFIDESDNFCIVEEHFTDLRAAEEGSIENHQDNEEADAGVSEVADAEVSGVDAELFEKIDLSNPDEIDESETVQHLRDVFNVDNEPSDGDISAWESEGEGGSVSGFEPGDLKTDHISGEAEIPENLLGLDLWTWDMSQSHRISICQAFVDFYYFLLNKSSHQFSIEFNAARRDHFDSKIRANAHMYEGKAVIGGTIVGCISRLEAIRSTNPFAILVEEASEVAEPLLFACLGSSTRKLEMIGDHLQLQPSIMSKFDFERINKVNVSMFERLISSPVDASVPSSVLSIQRRMRKEICDLTREYYRDIVEIEDHEVCGTKLIARDASTNSAIRSTPSNGREVPGIQSHLFFWTHNGIQRRANVGLSKVNYDEAEMVCSLAKYLVACGIPKTSIAILTPYKGQLMHIRNHLKAPSVGLISLQRSAVSSSCILSTVDRFQGDEADVVIVSLVADSKSRSPFVERINRMIVLLSRARLGMFIVGNIGYFQQRQVPHWQNTLDILSSSPEASDTPDVSLVGFCGSRIGPELPISCPKHPDSLKMARRANDLGLGFCKVLCDVSIWCSHPCGLECHFPSSKHQTTCQHRVTSPCIRHPTDITCAHVYDNIAPGVSRKVKIDSAIAHYRCPVESKIAFPCSHIESVSCSDEMDYSSGAQPWPRCEKPAHCPFVYPQCKHELTVKCYEFERYSKMPSAAGQCMSLVTYTPDCDHSVEVGCNHASRYLDGSVVYQCSKVLDVHLPRCKHSAKVNCRIAMSFRAWQGNSCLEVGLVYEGELYGSKDADCKRLVELVRLCGHREKIQCSTAFEKVLRPSACQQPVDVTNPDCGHRATIQCFEKIKLKKSNKLIPRDPVDIIDESEGNSHVSSSVSTLSILCEQPVRMRRLCGHETTVKCHAGRSSRGQQCLATVQVHNRLCGHEIDLPCRDRDFAGWVPWVDGTPSSFSEHVILEDAGVPVPAPNDLKLQSCKRTMVFRQNSSCGHDFDVPCARGIDILLGRKPKPKCKEIVQVFIPCGHWRTANCFELSDTTTPFLCQEICQRQCWNYPVCGQTFEAKCCSDRMDCGRSTEWICASGDHRMAVQQCSMGVPLQCPMCALTNLDSIIRELREWCPPDPCSFLDSFLENSIPVELQDLRLTSRRIPLTSQALDRFVGQCIRVLVNYRNFMKRNQKNMLSLPLVSFKPHPCFIQVGKKNCPDVFDSRRLSSQARFLNGLCLREWTSNNFQRLSNSNCTLLCGIGLVGHVLVNPQDVPKSNDHKSSKNFQDQTKNWVIEKHNQQGFDSVQTIVKGQESCIFWDPYAVIADCCIDITAAQRLEIAERLSDHPRVLYHPTPISYYLPSTITPKPPMASLSAKVVHLENTPIGSFRFPCDWDGETLVFSPEYNPAIRRELPSKLQFVGQSSDTAPVFAGVNLLKKLSDQTSNASYELNLLWALELDSLGSSDRTAACEHLQSYIGYINSRSAALVAHPLLLLALARLNLHADVDKTKYLNAFKVLFSEAVPRWMTTSERDLVSVSNPSVSNTAPIANANARSRWNELKRTHGCSSDAIEELLDMIGLQRIKVGAVEWFKTALVFKQMNASARKKNMMALNFVFFGNPGTGKTTVARLYARILHDSGMRTSDTFIECSAQKLKDDGPDQFRKLVKSAEGGVLFIDEAYDLDPAGDFKGKPIVSELLTISENCRDRLSIILAGYEDDMTKKLFSYNEGLKSRFAEVTFDDFDESELKVIWETAVLEREWSPDEDIATIASKRLAKSVGRKGFGNARACRKMLEAAIRSATSREDFDARNMQLKMRDVIGEDPTTNTKVIQLMKRVNSQIGWQSIKRSFQQIIKLCSTNYELEIKGHPPRPLLFNRLFLGSPGTGKTTCAAIYGELLKHLGFLSIGDVVQKTASDLVGSHVGESQKKTGEVIDGARGKVLVIDEAYNLDDNLYGKQAIDVIVEKVSGSSTDDIAVLLLGYEPQMLKMIRDQNPGLARRFPQEYAFRFEDYNDAELLKLWNKRCADESVTGTYEVAEKAVRVLSRQRQLSNFGNAGSVFQLLRSAIANATSRADHHEHLALAPEDIDTGDDDDGSDPLAALDGLYRVDGIRRKLTSIMNALKVARDEGEESPRAGHFVFRGSPGTGKTTVARVMAKILLRIGVCQSDKLVETSALDLTGEYLGQTKKKLEERMNEAKGSVLFIDEAYELGCGAYGKEAQTSLVAAMTSPEYSGMVVIVAGYPKDMDAMLDRNAGLKSRFNNYIDFPDWEVEDCMKFMFDRAAKLNFSLDGVDEVLADGFAKIRKLPGFGNGRDVDKIWNEIFEIRASRVVNAPELEKHIVFEDVADAISDMIKSRTPPDLPFLSAPTINGGPVQHQTEERSETPSVVEVEKDSAKFEGENSNEEESECERDPGVDEAIWQELELAKKEHQAHMAKLKRDAELAEEEEARRKAAAALAEEVRRQAAIQERIRRMCPCPAGYQWYKQGGGWRCSAGGHFVSDAQLNSQFTV